MSNVLKWSTRDHDIFVKSNFFSFFFFFPVLGIFRRTMSFMVRRDHSLSEKYSFRKISQKRSFNFKTM